MVTATPSADTAWTYIYIIEEGRQTTSSLGNMLPYSSLGGTTHFTETKPIQYWPGTHRTRRAKVPVRAAATTLTSWNNDLLEGFVDLLAGKAKGL
jgi:hypothetical protein